MAQGISTRGIRQSVWEVPDFFERVRNEQLDAAARAFVYVVLYWLTAYLASLAA